MPKFTTRPIRLWTDGPTLIEEKLRFKKIFSDRRTDLNYRKAPLLKNYLIIPPEKTAFLVGLNKRSGWFFTHSTPDN